MSKRDEIATKLKAEIDELNIQLDAWEAKAVQLSDQVKQKYDTNMLEVRSKLDLAKSKLDEVQEVGADITDSLKDDAEDIWQDLKGAAQKIKSIFD
ncbi:MAG TPA: hypothetical protein DCZ03_04580 [Gammaproteobacteria bacterium]|nr:hypothetical protein [Gammaproteobacteria bacterium]